METREQGRNLEAQSTHSANKCVPAMDTTEGQGLRNHSGSQGKETSLASQAGSELQRWDRSLGGDPQGSLGALPGRGSQMSQTESRARGGHCGRVCTAFEDGKFKSPGGEQAAEIKRECGGLWLCRASMPSLSHFPLGGQICLHVCRTTDLQP